MFRDQAHLHRLQEDIWQWPRSRASVMVGAGFSLNAQPHPGVKKQFPTWGQLAWDLFSELYPVSVSMTDVERSARHKEFDRTSPMRLASEYEATFQRNLLNQKITKSIPNNLYSPGSVSYTHLTLPTNREV